MVPRTKPADRTDRKALGILLIVGSVFLMSFQDAMIKLIAEDLTLWQIYILRSPPALLVLFWVAMRTNDRWQLEVFDRWNLLRALFLTLMYLTLYAGLPFLDLATIAAALYTGPLFITGFSALVLRESVKALGWLAVAIGFIGVVIMLRPGADAFEPLVLLPVMAGLFYALAAIATRGKCANMSPFSLATTLNLVLFATGVLAVSSLALLDLTEDTIRYSPFILTAWSDIGTLGWLLVALMAILIVGISVGLAAAYQAAPPVIIATFDYSYLLFAVLWGVAIFSEVPDFPTIIGMLLIVAAGLMVVREGLP